MNQWPAPHDQGAAPHPPATYGSPFPATTPLPIGGWPPPPPPRRGPSPVAFWLVLVAVVGLTVLGLRALPEVTPPQATPNPSTTSTGSPTPARTPSPSRTTQPDEDDLTNNKLYGMKLSGNCPKISTPSSKKAYQAQVGSLLKCLETLYRPMVELGEGEYSPVKHKFFGTKTDTPCGGDTRGYAFYCESNQTVYFSERVYSDAGYARLSAADAVVHEYSHHVQYMMGILDASRDLDEDHEVITRRIELQVFCMTYYTFKALPSFALTGSDQSFFLEVWSHTSDPEGHGSVKAQKYWGPRGLNGDNLGACNTWTATKSQVR